jgi:predicted metal-dependent hydrolase
MQFALPFDARALAPTAPSGNLLAPPPNPPPPTAVALLYFVRHKRARRYLLRVEPDGRLRVTIPRGGSKREAEAFVRRNDVWVADQRARLTRLAATVEERIEWRARAAAELPTRLRGLAEQHSVPGLTRVTIRNQRTRWGSCGRDGHVSLNWRLILMPPHVRDYVLIHELMHLRRMDHSPRFWSLVAAACPNYEEARRWLRSEGRRLR